MKDVVYIYPCFNNYDLTIGECTEFILGNKDKVVVVDDKSEPEEVKKGLSFCKKNGVTFLINRGKGIQSAIQTVIDSLEIQSKWVIVMQQDVKFPNEAMQVKCEARLKKIVEKNYPIGAVGFQNYVLDSHYNDNPPVLDASKSTLAGALGVFFLSKKEYFRKQTFSYRFIEWLSTSKLLSKFTRKFRHFVIFNRVFAPKTYKNFHSIASKYQGLSSIQLPIWSVVAISVEEWKKYINLDKKFIFHLWFVDIAMQFFMSNRHVALDTEISIINDINVKEKYGQLGSHAEGKIKNSNKMEKYGDHLRIFEDKWGFDYEYIYENKNLKFPNSTLISEHLTSNPNNGPIKKFIL